MTKPRPVVIPDETYDTLMDTGYIPISAIPPTICERLLTPVTEPMTFVCDACLAYWYDANTYRNANAAWKNAQATYWKADAAWRNAYAVHRDAERAYNSVAHENVHPSPSVNYPPPERI